jgi:protein-disulfide isomerase
VGDAAPIRAATKKLGNSSAPRSRRWSPGHAGLTQAKPEPVANRLPYAGTPFRFAIRLTRSTLLFARISSSWAQSACSSVNSYTIEIAKLYLVAPLDSLVARVLLDGANQGNGDRVGKLATILIGLLLAASSVMATPPANPQIKITPELIATAKSLGDKNAPIIVEDFTDFQCPGCRILFLNTTSRVIDDYVLSGKVYLVHHDYPIEREHPYALEAARWANAAALVGKFEKVELALFTEQTTWGANGRIEDVVGTVLSPAEMKRVREFVNHPEIQEAITRDIAMARERGVNSTPRLFVTHKGQRVALPPGAVSYSILKEYLDSLLKQ